MPVTQLHRLQTTDAHPINSLALRSSSYVFVAQANCINLYPTTDPSTSRLTTYTGHNHTVNSLSFISPTQFVSVSDSLTIHDVSKEEYTRRITLENRFKINSVVSLNEDLVACCGEDKLVSLFDLRQQSMWKPIQTFDEARDTLNSIDYDQRRGMLVCGGSDGRLLTYDLRRGLCIVDELEHGAITDVQCGQMGVLMSVLQSREAVRSFDPVQEKYVRRFEKKEEDKEYKIHSRYGSEEKFVVSGSESGDVYVWDCATRSSTVVNIGKEDLIVNSVDTLGQVVACGSSDGCVTLLKVE